MAIPVRLRRVARSIALPGPPAGGTAVARQAPLVVLVASAVLLIVSEFLTMREIVAVTVVPPGGRTTGGAHHGYALAVLGVAGLPMIYGAIAGGSRPAALAVTVLGAVALAIVLIIDLPSLNEAGLIGRTYDLAEAHPGIGFWLQLVGAVGLLAGGLLLLRGNVVQARERSAVRRRRRATESATES
jgi:hypothetical protein